MEIRIQIPKGFSRLAQRLSITRSLHFGRETATRAVLPPEAHSRFLCVLLKSLLEIVLPPLKLYNPDLFENGDLIARSALTFESAKLD